MRALELSPGDDGAMYSYANYFLYNAQFDEAISKIDIAINHNPLSPDRNLSAGVMYCLAGRNDEAIEFLRNAVLMAPDLPFGHIWLGRAYARESMYEEALAEIQKESDINPWKLFTMGFVYVKMGKKDQARQLLNELIERSKQEYVPQNAIAWLYFALGENDQGFIQLDRAFEARDPWLTLVKVDPVFDNVRSDPRYIAMLKKIGLDK
jgi:tetratricopeptide (TPR) repeat protein